MKKEKLLGQIAYWLLAAFAVGLLLIIVRNQLYAPKEYTPNLVILGDSVLTERGESNKVTEPLEEGLNLEVFNATIGGSCITEAGLDMDVVSFKSLAKGIVAGEFLQQKTTTLTYNGMEYVPSVLETLETVDFRKVQILLLKYGMNDYHGGVPIEQCVESLADGIKALQQNYPKLRIILLTPSFSWYPDRDGDCLTCDFGGGTLVEYVNAFLTFGQAYGIEVLDQFHGTYDDTTVEHWSDVTEDGLHPNEEGARILTNQIIRYLKDGEWK